MISGYLNFEEIVFGGRCGSVYVATKVPPVLPGDRPPGPYDRIEGRHPTPHVRAEVERSLSDLQTDCLDLIQ
ncbi:MAG: hypothetical protein EXQ58_07955 [Acidobacteria bacterium]|nr:hypothetical protein [Acidobacteriota bacterium]